ncbi:hypothetical protein [Novosphingobium sp. ST904]|uniref:hypothetical protein n=1 Tax=Novosphingobium sp. ST904 TaxID=1684385 RepID=UPI0006C842A6|nr:hypothetical protein [Novosphingobium sp. ST904]
MIERGGLLPAPCHYAALHAALAGQQFRIAKTVAHQGQRRIAQHHRRAGRTRRIVQRPVQPLRAEQARRAARRDPAPPDRGRHAAARLITVW